MFEPPLGTRHLASPMAGVLYCTLRNFVAYAHADLDFDAGTGQVSVSNANPARHDDEGRYDTKIKVRALDFSLIILHTSKLLAILLHVVLQSLAQLNISLDLHINFKLIF